MKHFILTRFNLGLYSDNPYKVHDPDLWLSHRLKLFDRYCLPSVLRQTCQNFTWVQAWDENTPDKFIRKYDYLENILIVNEQPHLWLRKQPPESDWLITSRFDNDDIYLPGFVEVIQKTAKQETMILDIDYHAWDMYNDVYYKSGRSRPNSPFLSFVEPWNKEPITAMGRRHSVFPDEFPAVKLEGIHAIQVIHDRNQCNKIQGERI